MRDCAALLAAALTSPPALVAESVVPALTRRSLQDLPCSAFLSQLYAPFSIHAASGQTIKVTLAEVKIRREKPPKPGRRLPPDAANEKFSLFFSGSRGDLLPQDVYSVAHETLGQFDLFLVPICTRNPDRIDYEAVINRRRNATMQANQTKG